MYTDGIRRFVQFAVRVFGVEQISIIQNRQFWKESGV